MKKGLKHFLLQCLQVILFFVGRIDLMKKGLKQPWLTPPFEIFMMLEGLTWWRRDWNNPCLDRPIAPLAVLEGLTWWRRDWNIGPGKWTARDGGSWKDWPDEEGIETAQFLIVGSSNWAKLEGLTWWRRDWNIGKGKPTRNISCELEGLTWWRRDWNVYRIMSPFIFFQVGRIDLMKKGLKPPQNEDSFFHLLSLEGLTWWRRDWNRKIFSTTLEAWVPLEGLTWWRRDWNEITLIAMAQPCFRWKDWPDEEGIETSQQKTIL